MLELTRLSGSSLILPTSIMPPRIAEFSVSYQFWVRRAALGVMVGVRPRAPQRVAVGWRSD